MKKISVLKLGNMNRENLEKREMGFLIGGNE
jgi:natural product precursor